MRAIIKRSKWVEFMNTYQVYGFTMDILPSKYRGSKTIYVRPVEMNGSPSPMIMTYLIISMDGELHLVTPMGESPYMESHKDKFEDLLPKHVADMVDLTLKYAKDNMLNPYYLYRQK